MVAKISDQDLKIKYRLKKKKTPYIWTYLINLEKISQEVGKCIF